jgi:hypothetical protein
MKKIDTWLFILFFVVLYTGFFWFIHFVSLPYYAPLVLENNFYTVYTIALGISSLASFLAAFGLRSYYTLPTTLLKLTNAIVVLQFILNVLSVIFEKPTMGIVAGWVVTALVTWVVVYFSFKLSDTYFNKQ